MAAIKDYLAMWIKKLQKTKKNAIWLLTEFWIRYINPSHKCCMKLFRKEI